MWILHLVQVSQFHFPQSCLEYIFSNVRDSQALCRKQTASTLLCPLDRLKPGTAGIKIRWKRELMNLLVWWLLIKESLVVQWWHVCHSAKNCLERFLMRFLLWGFGFVFLVDGFIIYSKWQPKMRSVVLYGVDNVYSWLAKPSNYSYMYYIQVYLGVLNKIFGFIIGKLQNFILFFKSSNVSV